MIEKNHIGRPSNEEVANRKKKKVIKYCLITIVSLLLVGGIFIFFNRDNIDFSSLMGNSSVNKNIKSSKETMYGYTYLKGLYSKDDVSTNYTGKCLMMVKEEPSQINKSVYYYKRNNKTGKYEKVFGVAEGVKYINKSKTDGLTYMQWFLTIDGTKYYTSIYKRKCTVANSEIELSSNYISKVNSKYSTSNTEIDPKDSILITTANYQVSLRKFKGDSNLAANILSDIKNKYIFTAPHSVKQWRNNDYKVADSKTGVICETLAKLTNSVCISRVQFDKTDPNYDSYEDSVFQQFVVNLINKKNTRLLVDLHGIKNGYGFDFAVGTRNGRTLYSNDKCNVEKNIATSIKKYAKGAVVSLNKENDRDCGFDDLENVKITERFNGGSLVANTKKQTVNNHSNFSSVQIEISNSYRTDTTLVKKTVNAIYNFVNKYK